MGDAAANFFELGIKVWNTLIEAAIGLLSMSPETFNPTAWVMVEKLNNYLFVPVAQGLLIIFFVIGFCESTIDIRREFKMESVIKMLLKVCISSGLVSYSLTITKGILQTGANFAIAVTQYSGGATAGTQYKFDTMIANIRDLGFFEGLGVLALNLIAVPVICVMSVMIYYTCLIRLLKIYTLIPFGSLAFASAAGGQTTGQSQSAFVKYIISVAGEAVFIVVAIVMSVAITKNGGLGLAGLFGINVNTSSFSSVACSLIEVIINLLVTVGLIKGGQGILQKAFAL